MEDDKPIGQEPEIAADVQPSKPAENETNEEAADTQPNEPTTENETNATDEVTETPEVDQEQDKSLNNGDANKPIESPEPQTEENKKPDVKPMRTTRATKRKANDADENENVNNSPSNEHSTEQKENVEVKSQDSELKENEATKVEESSLKSLSTVDGMGKGKRARIPNKRYSDIILSPNRKASTHQKSFSDIVEPEMSLAIKNEPVEPTLPLEASSSTHSLPKRSRASLSEELRDPKYLKPFKHGWKRELVRRATTLPGKRLSDVYYFNPEGKKLRSFREVSDYLTNSHSKQLSLDNFTFTKEPLGLNDPTKEIVRDAKAPGSTEDTSKADVSTPGRGKKRVATTASDPPPSVEKKKKENLKQAPVETPVKQSASKKIVKMPASKAKETPAKRPKRSAKVEESPLTQPSRSSPRKTRGSDAPAATTPSPKPEKRGLKLKNITNNVASTTSSSGSTTNKVNLNANFLGDCASIFNSLLHVFQYLKVQDLLRAGRVSRMWRAMADNPLLWRTVRMKNSQVHSFEGLANALKKHGTVHLDLRKMLLPSSGDDIWPDFSTAIARVDSLRKIEFCRCPASVVEQLATSNPNLEVINAVTIKCDSLNLDPFKSLTAIRELRLKSTSGLNINSIDSLGQLKTLKILSLTSVIDLHNLNLAVIGELTNLESLDLGECLDFPENFGRDILLKLDKLEKLRLEKGQGNCHTFEILESIKDMKKLEQLELVNFDVKPGFDKALGACKNIKKLMIIPTYISQSATTNNMVLAGVLRLQGTLVHFVWGVTLELLRVTELFIDQCEDTNKREKKLANNGDCIPVLKPVPDLSNGNVIQPASNPPQVEILPLPNLQKLLLTSLPTTRVKILKIPFHATWRQTLIDSM